MLYMGPILISCLSSSGIHGTVTAIRSGSSLDQLPFQLWHPRHCHSAEASDIRDCVPIYNIQTSMGQRYFVNVSWIDHLVCYTTCENRQIVNRNPFRIWYSYAG